MAQPTQGAGQGQAEGPSGPSETVYSRLVTKDTSGKQQDLYAAHRNGEFVLFRLEGKEAQVLYLLKAATPAEVRGAVSQRIIDVVEAEALPARPEVECATLLTSHPWTEMQKAVVGVILETRQVKSA